VSFSSCVVVGVVEHQKEVVMTEAARLAARFGVPLVCAFVDVRRFVTGRHEDGTVTSVPIDPDLSEVEADPFDPELADRIHASIARSLGAGTELPVIFRQLAGDPADALGALAEQLDAELIVVGSRHPGLMSGVRGFFAGSVAVRLAHRQHRPVVVVPVAPVKADEPLPWERS